MSLSGPAPGSGRNLPERPVSFSRVIAYNMAYFRDASGMGHQELGNLVGWNAGQVLAAERSWNGTRVKKFDADEIAALAHAVGVPVGALFLPPEDDGVTVTYVIETPGGQRQPLRDLVPGLCGLAGSGSPEAPAAQAYRMRMLALGFLPSPLSGHEDSRPPEIPGQIPPAARAAASEDRPARPAGSRQAGHPADEAGAILDAARSRAEEITRTAQARTESLEQDARERHRQALRQHAELERQISDLRRFERGYRNRLLTFIEGQYAALWSGNEGVNAASRLETIREQLSEHETETGSGGSAILLAADGTYDILDFTGVTEITAGDGEQDRNGETGEHGGETLPAMQLPRRQREAAQVEVPEAAPEGPRTRVVLPDRRPEAARRAAPPPRARAVPDEQRRRS